MAAPMSPDDGVDESVFEQELELLQEIYIHEMNIKKNNGHPCELSVVLHPATADRADLQYVTLTLIFQIAKEYPDVLPEITIRNPRGLSEGEISSLENKLKECAESRLGEAMLFELIEIAKESLTANNTPSCECVICCHTFEDNEVFTKTRCYHYFHNNCLVRYFKYAAENEEKAVCPVCREDLEDIGDLSVGEEPTADVPQFIVDPALKDWQIKMSALKTKQAQKGGIIDVEANSNKFLLDISSTPTVPVVSVPLDPTEGNDRDDKKSTENSSSRKVKGLADDKSDTRNFGRARNVHSRGNQYNHSAADRHNTRTRRDRESRPGSGGNSRGRYNHSRGHCVNSQRKARSAGHAPQRLERVASKPAPASSKNLDAEKIPQRNLLSEKDPENIEKKADDVDSIVGGLRDEDIEGTRSKEMTEKDEERNDKRIVEEKLLQGDGRTQSEVTSEEREEQKRTKQPVYTDENKGGVKNNAQRVHCNGGRGSGRRGRGGSANISKRNYRNPGWKKQNNRGEVRDKSEREDVLCAEGKERRERDRSNIVKTSERSHLNHSAEGIDKPKIPESQSGDRSKKVPPGFQNSDKIKPPPGFEEFR